MLFFFHMKMENEKKNVTLQVRKSPHKKTCDRKRVWLSASLTVEAALGLSWFVLAAVTLMLPMKVMDHQRKIQAALEAVCEDASKFAYITYQQRAESGNHMSSEHEESLDVWGMVDTAAVCLYASINISKYVDSGIISHISFARTKVEEEENIIYLVMDYNMKFPFPIFRISGFPMTSISRRRAWTGRDGGLGNGYEGTEWEDEIVYVGKNSTRYHVLRTCHYLDNHLNSYGKYEIGEIRNEHGKKYSPCAVCGKLAGENATVYTMPSGSSYHSNPYCSSIIAYVKAVPLSEVSYLGACSYCSK